ncbi:MAG: hypothetical protein IH626_06285 [Rhodospirillales bacterium]|nr:hypothetical protein [Rhodospirillales bacterium]
MKSNFRIFLAVICLVAAMGTAPKRAQAADGPVVLTVAGAIANANRGPVDPFDDGFFNSGQIAFDKAAAFDIVDLQALGVKRLEVRYPDWPKGFVFEGPLLGDVLAKAGATGKVVRVQALDGYAAEIPMEDIRKYPVVLAIKRDGRFLGIGDRGPAWVVFPRDDYPEFKAQDDSKWVWAVYYIHVE